MSERRAHRSRLVAAAGLVVLAAAVAGCSDSPEQCTRPDLGYFTFTFPAPEGDIFTTVTGVLSAVDKLPAVDPPQVAYTIRKADGGDAVLAINDLGYLLPVQVDSSYTIQLEDYDYPGTLLRGYSIVVWKQTGEFVAMVVSDWLPQTMVLRGSDPSDDNFDPGPDYPIQDLEIFFADEGCSPRVLDTREVRDITNRTLEFKIGSSKVRLFHGERGTVGQYEAEVFRAHHITAKVVQAVTPQISYVLESRDALALPRAGS